PNPTQRYTTLPYTTLFRSKGKNVAPNINPLNAPPIFKTQSITPNKPLEIKPAIGMITKIVPNPIINNVIMPIAGFISNGLLGVRSEEHTSELQSRFDLVCR